jgi:hypothetical protein
MEAAIYLIVAIGVALVILDLYPAYSTQRLKRRLRRILR